MGTKYPWVVDGEASDDDGDGDAPGSRPRIIPRTRRRILEEFLKLSENGAVELNVNY